MSTTIEALREVSWLGPLDPGELEEVAAGATERSFATGETLIGELEVGDELFILVAGSAELSVAMGEGKKVLGTLKAGHACGELSLLTRQLRSASVTALEPVQALRLDRVQFEGLVLRHPAIAVHFAREIAGRVMELDTVLEAMLAVGSSGAEAEKLQGHASAVVPQGGGIARAWRELVVSHRSQLPFFSLLAFCTTLVLIRLAASAVEHFGGSLFAVLRLAYVAGIVLILGSTATSIIRFRRKLQREVAVSFGVGFALLLNELSVFLAFDSFYLDMTHADPRLPFKVETLYRRSESVYAVVLMLAFLALLTFLGPFVRRVAFVLRARLLARMG
jgi:CRP-like cAMP-binding protein